MKSVRNILWTAISLVCISGVIHAASVQAATPTEQLKESIDQVLKILKDESLKQPGKDKERRAVIRKVIGQRFDFEEMSKRSLATHWAKRTPPEKKEFVEVFTNLLERSYMDRIEAYTDEQVEYNDEKIDEGYAVVRTTITAKDKEPIPIDYKLIKESDNWRVYDVVIEGVSLVNNYRGQFNKIISANSYQELLRKMKSKEAEILKGSSGKKKSAGGLD
jgi:phospholipid transport system substrate-binding protein